jgi:hypothetical protein
MPTFLEKTSGPENEIVAEQDMVIKEETHGTYENPWQWCPVCQALPSGTPAVLSGPHAETNGTLAETSGTVTEISGKPTRISRPIRHGVKRNILK